MNKKVKTKPKPKKSMTPNSNTHYIMEYEQLNKQ